MFLDVQVDPHKSGGLSGLSADMAPALRGYVFTNRVRAREENRGKRCVEKARGSTTVKPLRHTHTHTRVLLIKVFPPLSG